MSAAVNRGGTVFAEATRMHAAFLGLFSFYTFVSPALAQVAVHGRVDAERHPAEVTLSVAVNERTRCWETLASVRTDAQGRFEFRGVPSAAKVWVCARWSEGPNSFSFATIDAQTEQGDVALGVLKASPATLTGRIGIEDFRDGMLRNTRDPVLVTVGLADAQERVFSIELDLSIPGYSVRGLPPRSYRAWFSEWPRTADDPPGHQTRDPFPLVGGGEASTDFDGRYLLAKVRVPQMLYDLRAALIVHSTVQLACDEPPPPGRLRVLSVAVDGVRERFLDHDGGPVPRSISVPGPMPTELYVLDQKAAWGARAKLTGSVASLVAEDFVPARGSAELRGRPFPGGASRFPGHLYLTLASAPKVHIWTGSCRNGDVTLPPLPRTWALRICRHDPYAAAMATPPSRPFWGETLESEILDGVRVLTAR